MRLPLPSASASASSSTASAAAAAAAGAAAPVGSVLWREQWMAYGQRWVARYVTVDTRATVFAASFAVLALLSANTLLETYFWSAHALSSTRHRHSCIADSSD
jgi:hypothetical protein